MSASFWAGFGTGVAVTLAMKFRLHDRAVRRDAPGMRMSAALGVRTCRGCGCTDGRACFGGCSWASEDVCSTCFMAYERLATTSRAPKGARATTMTALQIELRVLGRTWGDDFTDLMLALAQKYALGNEAGAAALIAAQRIAKSARARALVRETRVGPVVREARALVAVVRKAVS